MIAAFESSKGEQERRKAEALLGPEYSEKRFQEIRDAAIDKDIEILEAGGNAAVEILKQYHPDATSEEIEAAYKSRVNRYIDTMNKLNDLQIGNVIVDKDIQNLLVNAGFKFNADGVITKVGDMLQAYTDIYYKMKETAKATTSELNAAYAKVLTT
jgi:hypothetical protein